MKNLLKNKVCIVTGAGQGIGYEIAKLYAQSGASAVYACDLNVEQLKKLTAEYQNVIPYQLNVTKVEEINKLAATLEAKNQNLDVLVNNAGIINDAMITKMSDDAWNAVIDVNLKGVFNLTRGLIKLMYKNNKGSIINLSSIVGTDGNIGQSNYGATKGGVIAMSKGWAKEFALKGAKIRVNCIAPGFVASPMTAKVPENVIDFVVNRTILKRLGTPDDIAQGALFLASDNSSFITGQVLKIDGGLVL